MIKGKASWSAASDTATPASPCVRNCCLDEQDICLGCGRTLSEILAWHDADEIHKRQILDACRKRRRIRPTSYT
ncbi:DUF1289 domain-containing protein [Shewanella yunxiaonensis]|uniref:DUF1289 domain-containing protein n=1 Tax=Shewanella yunxiaonensis TaxID=2829809 RepID=A0ABX7YPQ0_9GAMM|nr:DUF1289 domain-containing protein [Shewanella yunxiaonensis]QUN04589.1 DUF1289 domain-containing protein [Shewanella yunxiaonensis]